MEQEDPLNKFKQYEDEKQELLNELRRLKRKPGATIGYYLLAPGIILLALAILLSHNISAFIGIALTLLGALLLYIRPTRFIRKEILDATINSLESYYHLLIKMGYEGTPQHISPSTLWGQTNTVLYIPKSDDAPKPTDEQLSNNEILINDTQAIKIIPPGQSLSRLIENELQTNLSTVDIKYLQNSLEKALVEGLEIVKAFQIVPDESTVHVEMKGSIFYDATKKQIESKTMNKMGDPLNSAIACILARSTRKPIVIENIEIEPKEKTVKTDYKIL